MTIVDKNTRGTLSYSLRFPRFKGCVMAKMLQVPIKVIQYVDV